MQKVGWNAEGVAGAETGPTASAAAERLTAGLTSAREGRICAMADLAGSGQLDLLQFASIAELMRFVAAEKAEHVSPELLGHVHELFADRLGQAGSARHTNAIGILHRLDVLVSQGRRPTAPEFARTVGVNLTILETVLGIATGRSFSEWRRLAAVRHAARRLRDTPERVSQIAYSVGYDHHSQFDREFRRTLGLTPKTYRQTLARQAREALRS